MAQSLRTGLDQPEGVDHLYYFHTPASLHPDRLSPSDFADLSKSSACILCAADYRCPNGSRIAPHDLPVTVPVQLDGFMQFQYASRKGQPLPFPEGTRGFFYCYSTANDAITTEIRFRITDSPSPDAFHRGRDLMRPHGGPYSISLIKLMAIPRTCYNI